MSLHHRHGYAHLVQREPQNDIPITKSRSAQVARPTTTENRAARPTSESDENGGRGGTGASSTGVLLGKPVFATSQASPSPTPTPENNENNGNNDQNTNGNDSEATSPSPTPEAPVVVATSSQAAQPTTFATSTVSPTPFDTDPSSTTRGGSSTGSKTTSSVDSASTEATMGVGSTTSQGMSTGAKVGLAVGIIAIIGAFALFLMLFMAKKRKQREAQEKAEDEKRSAEQFAAANAAAAKERSVAPTPRLSLRPVSRLVPDLMGGNRSKNRLSQGNMLTTFSESRGDRSMSPSANMHSSQPRENPFNDPVNPFNDPEKAAAAAGAAAVYQQPHGQAHELEDTRSLGSRPGTSHSQFPGAPAPAVATGPGPDSASASASGNVYRILMDFKPTMEDELELRSGQHVRMLHEYDDGWALCIRLDRSQQGVVPRTCLAGKPSKPRPAPGPNGPNGYRGSPGPQSRPITPSTPGGPRMNSPSGGPGFRPESPANRPQTSGSGAPRQEASMGHGSFNQAPRPLSPGPRPQKRSESPGPYGAGGPPQMQGSSQRPRSNSTSNSNARGPRNSPPGPSNLGPGFAL